MDGTGIHEGNDERDGFKISIFPSGDLVLEPEEEKDLSGIVTAFRSLDKVQDDEGQDIDLTAEIKAEIENPLSRACISYTRVDKVLYQVCRALFDLHEASSPHRLFRLALRIGKIPERTAYLYLRIYRGFRDNFAAYALGVRKLDVMSGLEDPVAFLEQHKINALEEMNSEEVTKLVDAETGTKRNNGSQPRVNRRYGLFRYSEAANGKSFSVHCRDEAELRKVMDLVESHLKALAESS